MMSFFSPVDDCMNPSETIQEMLKNWISTLDKLDALNENNILYIKWQRPNLTLSPESSRVNIVNPAIETKLQLQNKQPAHGANQITPN